MTNSGTIRCVNRFLLACCIYVAAIFLINCAHQPSKGIPLPATYELHIEGAPEDAWLTIDDQVWGMLMQQKTRRILLPAGKHRLEFRRDGFFDKFIECEVRPTGENKLTIKMRRIPFSWQWLKPHVRSDHGPS